MHFVTESASSLREQKRSETSRRIRLCAQRLADDRGLDGFTMDDLAEAAGVSRRTLFNYFPGKVDAVLGEIVEIPQTARDEFVAGGPTGRLLDDVAVVARTVLAAEERNAESLVLGRRLLTTNHRLFQAAHERFELMAVEFVDLVLEREGADFGAPRARVLLALLGALLDAALLGYIEGSEDRSIVELFDANLAAGRALFS
jgi:AcrR family transcriptional regulator